MVEAHVDFDGGLAGDGGGDVAVELVEGGAAEFAFGDLSISKTIDSI
jgi:hypothetical protein